MFTSNIVHLFQTKTEKQHAKFKTLRLYFSVRYTTLVGPTPARGARRTIDDTVIDYEDEPHGFSQAERGPRRRYRPPPHAVYATQP